MKTSYRLLLIKPTETLPAVQTENRPVFLRDLETDPSHRALVSAIVRMAQALGLHTTAEGLETHCTAGFFTSARLRRKSGLPL